MAKEAVINEGMLQRLAADPRACQLFPYIAHFAKQAQPRQPSCCGRNARSGMNFKAAKLSLFGMSDTELTRLKAYLEVERLVFFFPGPHGTARQER